MLTIISVHHPVPSLPLRIGNTLAIFKTNQQALLSIDCPGIFSSYPNGRPFLGGARRGVVLWDYSQEHLVVIKDEKICPFVKFEMILPLLRCLLVTLTNKHYWAWSFMINLWIDSSTYQKYRILLSARQRSNNYLELSNGNVLGNMMLSHWPCFAWKFFMVWFHKILKLIFQKQPSYHRNICTEYCRKAPIFTAFLEIFLYFKNNDSVEHV